MTQQGRIRGLYVVADASCPDPAALVRDALLGGCRTVQLRAKGMPATAFLALAGGFGNLCRKAGARFIVNDRADIALACGADGVHLGQDDLPLSAARRIMGDGRIIGISTHTVEEAVAAEEGGADYIGFGPVFGTATKRDALSPRGLDMLARVRQKVSLPIVAIGGIGPENAAAVMTAGADGIAVVSAVANEKDRTGATARLIELTGENS